MHQGFYRYKNYDILWTIVLNDKVALCNPIGNLSKVTGGYFDISSKFLGFHKKVL